MLIGEACFSKRRMVAIAAGGNHTCGILDDGSVKCWGRNADREKDGTSTNNTNAVTVNLGQRAIAISTGEKHTCAILADKSLKCWGLNSNGQTNNSVAGDKGMVTVSLGNSIVGAAKVAAGKDHTCVVLDDDRDTTNGGPVKCWGLNDEGQTTHATNGDKGMVEVNFGLSRKAVDIAVGHKHSCAILANKSVRCWGANGGGQTSGIADSGQSMRTPDLGVDRTAVAIGAGTNHTCVILDNGSINCWGDNSFGQTAGGVPQLGANRRAVILSVGLWEHNCAILDDKSVKCWGANTNGRKDDTYSASTKIVAVDLVANQEVIDIGAGNKHTCAILDDGSVKCWGDNTHRRKTVPNYHTACAIGYLGNTYTEGCRAPSPGKYVDASRTEQDCDDISNSVSVGGKAEPFVTATTCPFTCDDGYLRDGRACIAQ